VAVPIGNDRSAGKASFVRQGFEEMLCALACGPVAEGTAVGKGGGIRARASSAVA
jgi:hypothetical protein